ncbi:MAG: hypothetical protein WC412_02850 [Candidatus Omnitrophota bacterium]|jgi:hypothetical protein
MNIKDMQNPENMKHRVITMLDRGELDFLDKLGKDALFSTGHKLSHNEILRALIDFSREIGLSANDVDSDIALKEKLFRQIRESLQK